MDKFLASVTPKDIISQVPQFDNLLLNPDLGIQSNVGAGMPERPLNDDDFLLPADTKPAINKEKKVTIKQKTKKSTKKTQKSKPKKKKNFKMMKKTVI